jgi:DNA repair protein RadD
LRVEYRDGHGTYCEWLALEHEGPAQRFAVRKWRELGGKLPAPTSVDEALSRSGEIINQVRKIAVVREGKYWRVLRRAA